MLRADHDGSHFHNCAAMTANDLDERKGPSRRVVLCHLEY